MSGLDGLDANEGGALTDGIVVGYKYFGSSEKGDFPVLFAPFDLGRTTTHEVGHWLGLRHIWGDGDCSADDFCADTPTAFEANNGCPFDNISCGSLDMIENYMDYTDDACMNVFTNDQTERMRIVLENSPRRRELVQLFITAVNEENEAQVTIYPNPVATKLTIDLPDQFLLDRVLLFSLNGAESSVQHINLSDTKIQLDFSNYRLSNGPYILGLVDRDSQVRYKKLFIRN